MARHQRGRRTHERPSVKEREGLPASFIFTYGKTGPMLRRLMHDLRNMMKPHTATNLRVSKRNKIKDVIALTGPFGITHLFVLTLGEQGSMLRIARMPAGPTVYFRINRYSLAADLVKTQSRPLSGTVDMSSPALCVLSGFDLECQNPDVQSPSEAIRDLVANFLQNMFAPISAKSTSVHECTRTVLISRDPESELIQVRQYAIRLESSGLAGTVDAIIGSGSAAKMEDFDELMHDGTDPATIALRSSRGISQRRVRLVEIGPRLELELLKIVDEVDAGTTIYHRYLREAPVQRRRSDMPRKVARTEK